jgi:hypothetical protein
MPPRYALAAILFGLAPMAFGNAGQAARLGHSFDGRWIANVPPVLSCSPSRLTLDVRGGVIVGNVVNNEGVFAVGGEVDAAGRGTIRIGHVAGVVRFAGRGFVADYPNLRCGLRHAVGFRTG